MLHLQLSIRHSFGSDGFALRSENMGLNARNLALVKFPKSPIPIPQGVGVNAASGHTGVGLPSTNQSFDGLGSRSYRLELNVATDARATSSVLESRVVDSSLLKEIPSDLTRFHKSL